MNTSKLMKIFVWGIVCTPVILMILTVIYAYLMGGEYAIVMMGIPYMFIVFLVSITVVGGCKLLKIRCSRFFHNVVLLILGIIFCGFLFIAIETLREFAWGINNKVTNDQATEKSRKIVNKLKPELAGLILGENATVSVITRKDTDKWSVEFDVSVPESYQVIYYIKPSRPSLTIDAFNPYYAGRGTIDQIIPTQGKRENLLKNASQNLGFVKIPLESGTYRFYTTFDARYHIKCANRRPSRDQKEENTALLIGDLNFVVTSADNENEWFEETKSFTKNISISKPSCITKR
mgnify:CR=1 FL=1